MSEELKVITTGNLRALIEDTEDTLGELKAELERREENDQHGEIDDLDNHFKNAELSLKTIKDFFAYLMEDMRKKTG